MNRAQTALIAVALSLLGLGLGFFVPSTAAAQPASEAQKTATALKQQHDLINTKLDTLRVDINFDEVRFGDVIDNLRAKTGLNIVADPKHTADVINECVNVKLTGVTARNALQHILKRMKLAYALRHGAVWITAPEDVAKGETVMRVYDVRDLAQKIKNFGGTKIRLAGSGDSGGGGGGCCFPEFIDEEPKIVPIDPEEMSRLVKDLVAKETWHTNPEASCVQVSGMLMIRQTPDVHREIERFLSQLRRNR